MKTYLRHRIVNLVDVKELMALEYLDFSGKYKNYTEHHGFWELTYVQEGNLTCHLGAQTFPLEEGFVLFVPPNLEHRYESEQGNATKAFVVCFECLSPVLKILGERKIHLAPLQQNIFLNIIDETQHTFFMNEKELLDVVDHPNLGGQQVIILHLEYFLITVLRELSSVENADFVFLEKEDFYANLVSMVMHYFHQNLCSRITLDDICHKVNYSKSFLCKTFKEQTGESLFRRFNRLKIEKAKELLRNTDLSAAKISELIGLTDAKYFNTLFRQYAGTTPAQFRKEYTETLTTYRKPSPSFSDSVKDPSDF